ncbi:MAG: hypothetical protein IIC24_05490 [Chloroflexi bacterium]|nr:hypothetical protein [Chloroflexota bacterium]
MNTQTKAASIAGALRELLEAAEHLHGAFDEDDARHAMAKLEVAIARAKKALRI